MKSDVTLEGEQQRMPAKTVRDNTSVNSRFHTFCSTLAEPADTVPLSERRQARLLSSLLVIVIPLGLISIIMQLLTVPGFISTFRIVLAGLSGLAVAYALSRTRHYKTAGIMVSIVPSIASIATLVDNPEDVMAFGFLLISVLVASMFFSLRATTYLAVANVIALLLLPLASPATSFHQLASGPLIFVLITSALILIAAWYRDSLSLDRRQELAVSEARYRTLFETMAQGVVYQDTSGKILSANRAASQILGLTNAQILGKDSEDRQWRAIRIDGTEFPGHEHPAMVSLRTGQPIYNVEMGVFNPVIEDYRWISVDAVPQFIDGENTPYQVYTTFKDITERRQAEAAQQDSKARLRRGHNLLSAISQIQAEFIVSENTQGMFDLLLESLLLLTKSEYGFIGEALTSSESKPFLKTYSISNIAWDEPTRFLHDQNAPDGLEFHNLQTLFGAVLESGEAVIANQPASDPRRGGLPSGHPPLLSFLGLPLYRGKRLIGMIGVANRDGGYGEDLAKHLEPFLATCANIIEAHRNNLRRYSAEKALRKNEARYRAIVEGNPDLICRFLPDTTLTFVNEAYCQYFGKSREALVGRKFLELIPPEAQADVLAKVETLVSTGQDLTYEHEVLAPGGDLRWQQWTDRPILDDDGEVIELQSIGRDITDRKWAEVKLGQYAAELEARVNERTHELLEANERLTELDQLKSRFITNVSHELRTPVANLNLYLDLLERSAPEKRDRYEAVLREQIKRLTNLLDGVLDFSRLGQGWSETEFGAVDLNELVAVVIDVRTAQAEIKDLSMSFELAPDLPPVWGEPRQLTLLAANLVTNALNFTFVGGVQVQTRLDDSAEFVRFMVRDTGTGFEMDELEHCFDPFYRGVSASEFQIPGAGLGLAIVKEIVERHNGRIEVDSQIAQGSTFTVWLPIFQETAID